MFNKKIKAVLIVFLLLLTLGLFGCESTDKLESKLNYTNIENAVCEYNSITNKTNIRFNAIVENNTIYNIDGLEIEFNFYNESNLVQSSKITFDTQVKHGDENSGIYQFNVEGKIDYLEYLSWTANYSSFWETYLIWIIATFGVCFLAIVAFIVFMILEDFDFDDIKTWIFLVILLLIVGPISSAITSSWICLLIVLAGVLVFAIFTLIALSIKTLLEEYFC